MEINTGNLTKAEVLMTLYNSIDVQERANQNYTPQEMTLEVAQLILKNGLKFKFLNNRFLNIDLTNDRLNVLGFDSFHGHGAAERALAHYI